MARELTARKVVFVGTVSRGVARGKELVERLSDRLEGILGFKPFPGTFDVRLEKPIDFELFETKRVEHVLLDGSLWIDARIAPVKLKIKGDVLDVWTIKEEKGLVEEDMLEVLAPFHIKDKYGLKDGDLVDVEMMERPSTKVRDFRQKLTRLFFPKIKRAIK